MALHDDEMGRSYGSSPDGHSDTVREVRQTARRVWHYLRSRPMESWIFFGAGFLLATWMS